MSTAEKVVIAFILGVLGAAVAALAMTLQRASANAVSPAAHRVHLDVTRVHGQRLADLWRAQDAVARRLARLERDGGLR